MKICDVVLNSVWFDPRVRKQIAEYLANNVNVEAVGLKCNRFDKEKIEKLPYKATVLSIDERFDGPQSSIFRKLKREWLGIKVVKDEIIKCKPDLIHANDLNALIPAYLAKKKLHCRLVYDSHEVNTENYFQGGHIIYAIMMKNIESYIVRRVDKMVCVSNAAADYFAKTYKIPKPLVVTNCSLKKEMVTEKITKNDGFEVINHGQLYAGRGYDIMPDVLPLISDYPDIRLAIRGFGVLEQQIRDAVSKAPNSQQFVFYPRVRVEELIPKAAASSVGLAITENICLNFKLSVSNKLFEYAAAGLPVIMSDIPEHRYLNEKYNFGIIIPDNSAKSLAEAVIKLYCNKSLYDTLSANSLKLSQELNWENEFGKLLKIERSLLK